jgi:hypothetical protein
MKKYQILVAMICLTAVQLSAQDITTQEAKNKVGQQVNIIGKVVNVVYWKGSNFGYKDCWFLNIDEPHPYNAVVVRIAKKNYPKFEQIVTQLKQKKNLKVRIKGMVSNWKPYDREISPTIELEEKQQLEIVEK